jgi:hypothetical protein
MPAGVDPVHAVSNLFATMVKSPTEPFAKEKVQFTPFPTRHTPLSIR